MFNTEYALGSLIKRPLPPGFESLQLDSLMLRVHSAIDNAVYEAQQLPDRIPCQGNLVAKTARPILLGAGGLAEVYLFEDEEFSRPVALKTIAGRLIGDSAVHRIFHDEYRVLGVLEHPGIPSVFGTGELPDGRPFYTMQLVKGRSLYDLIRDRESIQSEVPVEVKELVEILIRVAETISFAHGKGYLHGDVKSPNVMVGDDGEVIVVDWGLARKLDAQDQIVSGTPAWMAPEQADPEQGSTTERTEVYSLGAVLFEILTMRPPHDRADLDCIQDSDKKKELMIRLAATDPVPEFPTNRNIPSELVSLCRRALSATPAARGTVTEFRTDLQNWLYGRQVKAHSYSLKERASRWAWDHKGALGAVTGCVVAALAISALWLRASNAELTVELTEKQRENANALAEQRYQSAVNSWKESFEIFGEELQDIEGALPARKRIVERALLRLKELADTTSENSGKSLAAMKARTMRAGLLRVEGGNPRDARSEFEAVLSEIVDLSSKESPTELFAVHADALIGLVECELALAGGNQALDRLDELEQLANLAPKDVSDLTLALAADNLDVYRVRIRRRIEPNTIEAYALKTLPPALDRNRTARTDLKNGKMTVNPRLADFAGRRNASADAGAVVARSQLLFSESVILDELCFSMSTPAGAVYYAEQSAAICAQLVEESPDNKDFAAAVVVALTNLGRFKKDTGDSAAAKTALVSAVAQAMALRKKHPFESNLLTLRRTAEHNLANVYVSEGEFVRATEIFIRQIEEVGPVTEETPHNVILDLAQSYFALGRAKERAGETNSAFDAFLYSQELRSNAVKVDPSNADNIAEAAVLSKYTSNTVTGSDSWITAAAQLEALQECVLQSVADGRISNPLAIGQPAMVVANLVESVSKVGNPTEEMLATGRRLLANADKLTAQVKGLPKEVMQQLNDSIRKAGLKLKESAKSE